MFRDGLDHRLLILTLAAGLAACSGADMEETDSAALENHLRAQASGMTLWVSYRAERSSRDGTPVLRLLARTSKNLASARVESGPGTASVTSPRRFEVVLQGQDQIQPLLAGAPLTLALEASTGRVRGYQARLRLQPLLTSFAGDRRIRVDAGVSATFVAGADANLQFRTRFSVPAGAAPGAVSVVHPAITAVMPTSEGRGEFTVGLTGSALTSIVGAPGVPLVFQVSAGRNGYSKRAELAVAVEDLALTTADAPLAAERCDEDVAACLAAGTPPAGCGAYHPVTLCQAPVRAACDPNLEWEISDCVYRLTEDFAADPERGPIDDLQALEFCTREGDLTGPMFDRLCGAAPTSAFCACRGQATCFEAFDRDFVRPCAAAVRPRFDCALGRTYRQLQAPRDNIFVLERRVLGAADVVDSLRAQQIVSAVRESAHSDVTTLAEAFARVDRNQVNVLEIWEGSNDVPYTVVEYGAGDNSYGAVFHHGSTRLAARIQDSDLYDASTPPNLGCRIPQGRGWSRCESDAGCAAGSSCRGFIGQYDDATGVQTGVLAPGKCVAPFAESPRADAECSATNPCPLADNLACSSIASGNDGLCRPIWMFGSFRFPAVMPLPNRSTAQFPVMVTGLASVPEEAVFEATINSANFARLRLSLANPTYRTTSTFFDGPALGAAGVRARFGATSGEFRVRLPVNVPGDEGVNGEWLLMIDTTGGSGSNAAGASNIIYGEPTLTLSSRWD